MTPHYFSDLTDAQWVRLRSGLFAGHPSSGPLRRVVDCLLFRERAWCPWSLLPPDMPTAAEVKAHAATWEADGTWARVQQILAEPLPTVDPLPGDRPLGLRKRLARALRRVPGGRLALVPVRRLIGLVQYIRSRSTPHARLPVVFRDARTDLDAGAFAHAVDRYTHVLKFVPAHVEARLNRGLAYHRLGQHAAACADIMIALSALGVTLPERVQANVLLSEIYVVTGHLDRAVGHAYVARLLRRYGPDAPWAQTHLVEEADEFELLAAAYCEVGEFAINFASDFAAAAELAQRREQLHVEYERWLASTPAETLFLSFDWVRNIGHIALLDSWVKLRHLGWLDRSRIVVHAPSRLTANRSFLSYFKPHLKVVTDPTSGGATRHLAATFGPHVASVLRLPGHQDRYFLEGMGVIQEEWERQGRGPLLALSNHDWVAGRAKLQEMGMPNGAWFVALHVRSAGFYKEQNSPHQTHRNADIATYLSVIELIVRRGGWVVRVGDPSMPPLPPTRGVVDYARGPHKTEWLDVFLIAACRFFIGVASGLSQIPVTFGIPSLFTNWMSNALPVNSRHDLFIPKRVWSDRQNRLLTFEEWLNPINRSHYIAATEMRRAGLRECDNTPEELHEAVMEMLDRLDSLARYDRADDDRRELFEGIARRHGLVGFARIGRDFLRRHQHLLPQVEQRREAG